MEKTQHLAQSVVLLVEWIPGEFDAWAKIHEAYNVVTGDVMDTGHSPEAIEALDGIMREGYNGWTKTTTNAWPPPTSAILSRPAATTASWCSPTPA